MSSDPAQPVKNLISGKGPHDATDILDPAGVFHDNRGPSGRTLNDMAQEQTYNDQVASTSAQYNESAAGLDSTTRNEIQDQLASGDPYTAAKTLSAARAGTGIYAVRKINENQKKLINAAPGRGQLSTRYSIITSA